MSALDHKRTFAAQNAMSALPLKADIPSGERLALNGHYNSWGYMAAPVAIVLRQQLF
jgi:hypothetical protein